MHDVLCLPDRPLSDLALDAILDPKLERSSIAAAGESEIATELVEEPLVDLGGVRRILHLDRDPRDVVPRRDDRHLLAELRVRLLGRTAVAGVQAEHLRELDLHVLVVAVALVTNRLAHVHRVDEAHAPAEIEARDEAEADPLLDVARARDLAAGHDVERRPQREKREPSGGHHRVEPQAPAHIRKVQTADETPERQHAEDRHRPEGVVVSRDRSCAGTSGPEPEPDAPGARRISPCQEDRRERGEHVLEDGICHENRRGRALGATSSSRTSARPSPSSEGPPRRRDPSGSCEGSAPSRPAQSRPWRTEDRHPRGVRRARSG